MRASPEVELSLRQFRGAWQALCGPSPTRAIASDQGIDYVFCGLPVAFFNVAVPAGDELSADQLSDHGRQACVWASGRGVPWLFVVTHERLRPGVDATAALGECGLTPLMPLTGMIADELTDHGRAPVGLELTIAADDSRCAAILDVNAAAYGMDLAAGKALVGKASFWTGHVPMVGLADGRPASCAAVLMVDGYRYVAMVATDPGHQRRGYGAAVMRGALDAAETAYGRSPTVLHATAAGLPVYERMGYRVISNHTVFIEQRFLTEH